MEQPTQLIHKMLDALESAVEYEGYNGVMQRFDEKAVAEAIQLGYDYLDDCSILEWEPEIDWGQQS